MIKPLPSMIIHVQLSIYRMCRPNGLNKDSEKKKTRQYLHKKTDNSWIQLGSSRIEVWRRKEALMFSWAEALLIVRN